MAKSINQQFALCLNNEGYQSSLEKGKLYQVISDAGVATSYRYNADGQRVIKTVGTVSTWNIYGMSGELIAEYPANGATNMPQMEYGYRNGQMLVEGGCDVVRWMVADHLGTPRMSVDITGTLTNMKRHDYLPFGEEIGAGVGIRAAAQGYSADCIRQKFTGKERDTETGLDYSKARYYANVQGRFTSVDPTLLSSNGLNPQSWNRYTYGFNNPLQFIDPLGLWSYSINYEYYEDGDKKGQLKSAHILFSKTSKDDNAASLLKQFGIKTSDKSYGKLLEQANKAIGGADAVAGNKLGGDIGNFFKAIDGKLADQKRFDEGSGKKKTNGPIDADFSDCSMTACRLAYPAKMAGIGGIMNRENNFGIDEADSLLQGIITTEANLRIRDIVKYGNGERRHFTNVFFITDDGVTQVFSRSGVNGRFETFDIKDPTLINGYGKITGTFKAP